jgi:hypothetical protein
MYKYFILFILAAVIISCKEKSEYTQGDWITGTEQEKMEKIERHFRGFDMTMVETGYRYQELYWAGMDANWPYAEYQLQKIELTLSDGLERRPLRAPSAAHFINVAIPEMKSSIQEKDTATFRRAFQVFTRQCNACHAMEKVPHFNVKIPTINLSPISLENY